MRARKKTRGKRGGNRKRQNERGDRLAPVSSAAWCKRYVARSEAGAHAMPRARGHCRRNRLDRRPLALFRRLVGTGRLVARGVGHSRARRNRARVVSPGAGQVKRKLVLG